jgi:hypothetical protein
VQLRSLCLFMLTCLSMAFAQAGSAQKVEPLEPAWMKKMNQEGWQKVQEGVLRRESGEGRVETFTYGAEGARWLIAYYHKKLISFEGRYREAPTEELASLIEHLTGTINDLQDDALAAPSAAFFEDSQLEECSLFYLLMADAKPLTSTQGVTASATAAFQNNCGITGDTYAYIHAKAKAGTVLTDLEQIDSDSGTQVKSEVTVPVPVLIEGSLECFSEALASVTFPGSPGYIAEDTNFDCPDTISITGPSEALTDYYGPACADVIWTATAASGRTDYDFEWYIGANLEGTGPTLTKRFCNEATSVTVRAVTQDSGDRSYEGSYSTNISYRGPIAVSVSGPSTVNTDYYVSPCATVTWTASASGDHSRYTYNWYLGNGTTSQGTGSTFSKQYCSTSQMVNVKAVATASDGHSDSSVKTTAIVYSPQMTSSISGPATVTTDYYTSSCATVTWTASAAGGHPGYAYKWYLGTGTTVQGTGSAFSKQYCSTSQSVAVKVVITDFDGHSDTSTKTTTITHKPQLTTSVSGPDTVLTDYYTSTCATATWTASAAGGHPAYTYKWYLGTSTTVQGTGSTFSKQYCTTDQTVTVKAVATDSDGHTATSANFTTSVQNRNAIVAQIAGPATVSSSTSCTTVSWSANASGSGHSGFSYKWYIGTAQQTTGTTFSKQFCSSGGSNQSVTVKVTATASDGHEATDTHSTTITFGPPPLTASISGPDEGYIYGTQCISITWSAGVAGGTPAYTYSWTIGTSTTVLSTTSSLTKTQCTGQTLNVKLTVRDSAAKTANATFTTTVYKENTCFISPCLANL